MNSSCLEPWYLTLRVILPTSALVSTTVVPNVCEIEMCLYFNGSANVRVFPSPLMAETTHFSFSPMLCLLFVDGIIISSPTSQSETLSITVISVALASAVTAKCVQVLFTGLP